ncbi:MAG: tRNA uridine-5-carboxymethylaminomethyl(34) synthesis GTPase MnmE [Magnetococcales bacterium]|nr:tRNA uridine-5-carboxymethylaminomethyl(34) synthesis GTPase MnmE [Magnetococcales bacterium]MBF0440096.1 tRNA uridine-5-carboxymethylaminomethyl(34) synthesis GTPase MnmE [Magnetococcales bacterium]
MHSPLLLENDPIAGLATPPGNSALAIIRLTGLKLRERLLPLLRRPNGRHATLNDFTPRMLQRIDLMDFPTHGKMPLDKAMMVYFPAPHSYTGEDVVELHCHGSPVVVKRILELLTDLNIRPAKPGEFTRRAYLNGKMDLTQAEALISLINSATLRSAQEAIRQMEGSLSKRITQAKEQLLTILAHIEASLDFADEDVTPLPSQALLMEIAGVAESLGQLLRTAVLGKHLQDGFQLLIAGSPNVGKSSLFNRLLGRSRAIVAATPGTTRDCIESHIEIQGIPVLLIDTAGLRQTDEAVEAEGIKLTRERLGQADGVLLVLDAQQPISEESLELMRSLKNGIIVWNKIDLYHNDLPLINTNWPVIKISCLTGDGLDSLLSAIAGLLLPLPIDGEGAVIMAARQREAMVLAIHALAECEALIVHGKPGEITALPLRTALQALGEMVGQVTHDALLDRIFGTFCIGK